MRPGKVGRRGRIGWTGRDVKFMQDTVEYRRRVQIPQEDARTLQSKEEDLVRANWRRRAGCILEAVR
jgi:hypothetical protein